MEPGVRWKLQIAMALTWAGLVGQPVAAQADLPCVWIAYNLPIAGSGGPSLCSPLDRPPGWDVERTVSHSRPIIGDYYIGAGVSAPQPNGG